MKILILGASGFIAQRLVEHFSGHHDFTLIDKVQPESTTNSKIIQLDATLEEAFHNFLNGIPDAEFPNAMINLSGKIVSRGILNPSEYQKSGRLINISEHLDDFDSNFTPQIIPMICFSEQLVKRKMKGKIINFSSLNSKPTQGQLGYSTAKKSIESASKVIALELGLFGISVNCIAPGFLDLPNLKSNMSDERISQITQASALKNLVDVEDVFHAINFLLTTKTISGTVLHVHSTVE
jgi:NAD(P)-dependent dehydrogenase (short-subunit alcohol dehydrogenase family)